MTEWTGGKEDVDVERWSLVAGRWSLAALTTKRISAAAHVRVRREVDDLNLYEQQ